jgi:wyosine [tRNA(Phe)-imidazoG37] synthetase (radical SAM superfamily)
MAREDPSGRIAGLGRDLRVDPLGGIDERGGVVGGRRPAARPEALADGVERAIERMNEEGERVDYVTFFSAADPTLDENLGRCIDQVRQLGARVAVLTTGVLLSRDDVRAELARADLVSLRLDSVHEGTWRRMGHGLPEVRFDVMLAGMLVFAAAYDGTLWTETMLAEGVNTSLRELEATADFVSRIGPDVAHLSLPSSDPAAAGLDEPAPASTKRAIELFAERGLSVQWLAHRPAQIRVA